MKSKISKKAQKQMSWGMLLIVAVVVIGAVMYMNKTPTPVNPTPNSVSCSGSNPTFGPTAYDAVTKSAVTVGNTYLYTAQGTSVASRLTALPSTLAKDDVAVSLLNASGYISDVTPSKTLDCAGNNPSVALYSYSNASVTIKDDANGIPNAITQSSSGGAYNATAIASGGSRTYSIVLNGVSQKSTSKIYVIAESPASTAANLTSFTLTCPGASPVSSIPTGIAAQNAGSSRVAVEVPALIGTSATVTCSLYVQGLAGKTAPGAYLVTLYGENTFLDSTNTVRTGIIDDTPNGNNAANYITGGKYTANFLTA